jgi:hypothetical protein
MVGRKVLSLMAGVRFPYGVLWRIQFLCIGRWWSSIEEGKREAIKWLEKQLYFERVLLELRESEDKK